LSSIFLHGLIDWSFFRVESHAGTPWPSPWRGVASAPYALTPFLPFLFSNKSFMATMVIPPFGSDLGGGLLSTTARFPGVLQQGTCDGGRRLASASNGRRAALLKHGRMGGRSSTSMVEALSGTKRRSSTSLRPQVVRPRGRRGGRRLRFCVGNEIFSSFFLDLGVACASRSPANGGEGFQAPDCFYISCARVLFVNLEALSSNCRFSTSIVDARGPPCNYVPASFNISF
jgi:hypothetical protein